MTKNIAFQTPELARYFTTHRITWAQFYDSERAIINQLHLGRDQSVLDVGCGCGGLGLALRDEFGLERYTGVEINPLAADAACRLNPRATIFCGDILDISNEALRAEHYDVVFSLSCVDWNNAFSEMLATIWEHVRPGGHLVSTFRLTAGAGCNDIARSYQFINSEGVKDGELAPYVVLNATSLVHLLVGFDPSNISAVGYWGSPSATAVTPYDRLCFAAFAIRKRDGEGDPTTFRLDLPSGAVEPGVPPLRA